MAWIARAKSPRSRPDGYHGRSAMTRAAWITGGMAAIVALMVCALRTPHASTTYMAPAPAPLWFTSWGAKPTVTPSVIDRGTTCPTDMVEVQGDYCPYIDQRCLRWLDPPETTVKLRCAEFAVTRPCAMKTSAKHFCIDRYEWP